MASGRLLGACPPRPSGAMQSSAGGGQACPCAGGWAVGVGRRGGPGPSSRDPSRSQWPSVSSSMRAGASRTASACVWWRRPSGPACSGRGTRSSSPRPGTQVRAGTAAASLDCSVRGTHAALCPPHTPACSHTRQQRPGAVVTGTADAAPSTLHLLTAWGPGAEVQVWARPSLLRSPWHTRGHRLLPVSSHGRPSVCLCPDP